MSEMSEAAQSALIGARAGREGAALSAGVSESARAELSALGLLGPRGGLSRSGVIRRERLLAVRLEDAFA